MNFFNSGKVDDALLIRGKRGKEKVEERSFSRLYSLLKQGGIDDCSSPLNCSAYILAQKISYSSIKVLPLREQRQSTELDAEVFT